MFGFLKQERLLQRVREYMRTEGFELENLPLQVRQGTSDAVKLFHKKGGNEYDVVIKLCMDMVLFLHSKGSGSIFESGYGDKVTWINRATSVTKFASGNCASEQTESLAIMAASILMDDSSDGESI